MTWLLAGLLLGGTAGLAFGLQLGCVLGWLWANRPHPTPPERSALPAPRRRR